MLQHTGGLFKAENPSFVGVAPLPELRSAGRASFSLLPQTMALGVVIDATHNRAHSMHGPPRVECCVQPVLDRLRPDLAKAQPAPLGHDVLFQVELLLHASRLGDLHFAAKIALVVRLSDLGEQRDTGCSHLLHGGLHGGRVLLRQKLVALDFRLFLRDLVVAATQTHGVLLADGLD